jgi:F420-non-reducing hydrogenase iron-sulfur subunit
MKSNRFEPQIVAFCCKYCAYAAADLAGSMRLEYPPNLKIVQLPCSGRVDMLHLLKAIEEGADGVCVAGCLEGECHFVEGNLKTKKKVAAVKKILEKAGVESQRVEMYNLSSAMGPRFAEIAEKMTEQVRALGPSPVVRNLTAA